MSRAAPGISYFAVRANALDDGPGVRTVIFFKGCPLSCAWCHNPEGRRAGAELAFDAGSCAGCDACLAACPHGNLDRALPGFVDRGRCARCGACAAACPARALELVGAPPRPVEELARRVLRDLPFFTNSGGGVTLSGGEATAQLEGAAALARELKARAPGLHLLLETCGQFQRRPFLERLYPHLDLIYFDLKLHDPAQHRRLCGEDNLVILNNFKYLYNKWRLGEGAEVQPRIPLIPGVTATEENLAGLGKYLQSLGAPRVTLVPYNPLWPHKYDRIGLTPTSLGRDPALARFMEPTELERCREVMRTHGLQVVA